MLSSNKPRKEAGEMKKFFKAISGFFGGLVQKDEVLSLVVELLRTDRDNWTEVESHKYGDSKVLRYEGVGESFGTLIVLELLSSKIVLNGCEYQYFLDGSAALHQALSPVPPPQSMIFTDRGFNKVFDA
jgi:hypothetical protein